MHERAHTHEARAHARHRLNPRARAAWSRIDEAWVRARVCRCCQPAATAQQRERQYCYRSRSGGGGGRPRCGDARRRAGRPAAPAAATSAHRRSDGGALLRRRTHSPRRATASPTPPSLPCKGAWHVRCGHREPRTLGPAHFPRTFSVPRSRGKKNMRANSQQREKQCNLLSSRTRQLELDLRRELACESGCAERNSRKFVAHSAGRPPDQSANCAKLHMWTLLNGGPDPKSDHRSIDRMRRRKAATTTPLAVRPLEGATRLWLKSGSISRPCEASRAVLSNERGFGSKT